MRGLFFLAALLPPDLEEKIIAFKRDFAENFDAPYALNPPGHITLAETFNANAPDVAKFNPQLEKIFAAFSPITAEVRNFAGWPSSLSIVAAIQNPQDFQGMREALFWFCKNSRLLGPKAVPKKTFTPHITVGYRDLTEENFHAAWKKYSHLQFSADFRIDRIHLMHHRKKWQSVHEFPLLGLPNRRGEQLKLF